MEILSTNTRYIYDGLTDYISRLASTLPDGLDVGFMVNSGSEANELAIRLKQSPQEITTCWWPMEDITATPVCSFN